MFRNRGYSYLIKIFAWGYKVEKFLLAVGTLLYYGVTIWGEDKCTLYKNPAFLLGKHHFLVYKREVELQVNIRKMDQSCVSLLSGRVGGISLKAGHRTHSGHTVPFAPTAFPTEANRKEFAFRSIGQSPTEASKSS